MKNLLRVIPLLLLFGFQHSCRPPANCPGAQGTARCSPEGLPQWCDEGARWRSQNTLPCSATGGVCAIREGVATCTRVRDAGVAE